jgi:hypothetical protein
MNERIRELEAQCWEYKPGFDGQEDWYTVFNKQKFAELIVRECIEVMRLVPCECDSGRDFGDEVIYQEYVKKHFGVE